MTTDHLSPSQAYELLGVDATASAKELKRAYLRKTKVYKPERDPEGFQRLRAAYELVKELVDTGFVEAPAASEDGSEPAPEESDASTSAIPPEEVAREVANAVFFPQASEVPAAATRLLEYVERGNRSQAKCVYNDNREEWNRLATRPDVDGETRVTVQAAAELVEREAVIPDAFAEWMARGLLGEDLDGAARALGNLAREHPFATSQLLDAFEAGGSALALFYADALRSGASLEETPIGPDHDWVSLTIQVIFAFLSLLAMLHFKCGVFS